MVVKCESSYELFVKLKPWVNIPWSHLFEDITGNNNIDDNPKAPPKSCPTKFKCFHDNNNLYFGIEMIAKDRKVIAEFNERNDPIYQQDSDIEVFLDAYQETHNYKEFESNALNTVWNLLLNKPYSDGGEEFSGRVTSPENNKNDPKWWDSLKQKSGVWFYKGGVNSKSNGATIATEKEVEDNDWSIEISMPLKDIMYSKGTVKEAPTPFWKLNLSRVEDKGDKNWVWNPQKVYNPDSQTFEGKIDMHQPEAWGYLKLGGGRKRDKQQSEQETISSNGLEANPTSLMNQITSNPPPVDITFPLRLAASVIYHSQKKFFQLHGVYASSLKNLGELVMVKYDREDDTKHNAKDSTNADFWDPFHVKISIATNVSNSDGEDILNGYRKIESEGETSKYEATITFKEDRVFLFRKFLKDGGWNTDFHQEIRVSQDRLMVLKSQTLLSSK